MYLTKINKDGTADLYLTRGDTPTIRIEIASFTPQTGDYIKFSVKKSFTDSTKLISKTINDFYTENGKIYCDLTFTKQDTAGLFFGDFVYDFEINMNDGYVETPILGKFTLLEEVS